MPILDNSLFYRRLETLSAGGAKTDVQEQLAAQVLLPKVRIITGKAAAIAQYVVAFLPQYTDHGEQHLTNVLQFMEELAGPENIETLSALECALAIMAAFVHDLGMVPDGEEQTELTESTDEPTTLSGRAWQTYRDGHALWHRFLRLPPGERASPRARQMLGQLKADYIRDSHAKEASTGDHPGYHRILNWLDMAGGGTGEGKDFYRLDGFTFREGLAHLAMSHGQDIGWLPARLAATNSPYATIQADASKAYDCGSHHVNWIWLSWLLRLADIMDCDASRTPAVLFETIGITDAQSQIEWKKHLAIPHRPTWKQGKDRQTLLYDCPTCPDPFTEKAIHDILGWINQEIKSVRSEYNANHKHFPEEKKRPLNLPSQAEVAINERQQGYVYLNLHFRLDKEAVMELLMGEALYGEPDLALRELVQNSLDALHLRDLRCRLSDCLFNENKGEELPVPVMPLKGKETLKVDVRWEADGQRPWIEVEDNGVGMTREVIEKFLTQIGKSYYKSPAFLRERELMKRHHLCCTTISQFGIGFLSSFMLAEEISIETRAAMPDKEAPNKEAPYGWRVSIHGPHGLIALHPLPRGAIATTGTRVRLELRKDLQFEPFDKDVFRSRLRSRFYAIDQGEEAANPPVENRIEPAWSVARCIVWPLFPLQLHVALNEEIWLDESFHAREVLPLDQEALRNKAVEWDFPPPQQKPQHAPQHAPQHKPDWAAWNWVDDGPDGQDGQDGQDGTGSRVRVWFPKHVPPPADGAWHHVANTPRDPGHPIRHSEWLALAESQLPAHGRTLVLVNGVLVPEWKRSRLTEWLRLGHGVGSHLWLDLRGPATPRLRADRQGLTGRQEVEVAAVVQQAQEHFKTWVQTGDPRAMAWLRLAIAGLPPPEAAPAPPPAWSLASAFPAHCATDTGIQWLTAMLIQEAARALDRALALARALARALDRALNFDCPIPRFWRSWLESQLVPELFQPSLACAFPGLDCPFREGNLGDLALGGPLILCRPPHRLPDWLKDCDLVIPITGIALGPLARQCPDWVKERGMRPVFTLPFLLGEVPEEWHAKTEQIMKTLGVRSLLAYLPDPEYWGRAFTPIPAADFGGGLVAEALPEAKWISSGATALWDIPSNKVLWAEKLQSREQMLETGKPLSFWAKKRKSKAGR